MADLKKLFFGGFSFARDVAVNAIGHFLGQKTVERTEKGGGEGTRRDPPVGGGERDGLFDKVRDRLPDRDDLREMDRKVARTLGRFEKWLDKKGIK